MLDILRNQRGPLATTNAYERMKDFAMVTQNEMVEMCMDTLYTL